MSADNWGICPKCKFQKIFQKKAKEKEVTDFYGKISAEEFLKKSRILKDPVIDPSSLREDYEIRTDENGVFTVSYYASCETCNFSFEYKFKKQVYPEKG